MKKINIHFIVNPSAGKGFPKNLNEKIANAFQPHQYHIQLKETKYKLHAKELTIESMAQNANIIVACGGDGTINEVASCLVNSSIKLGIIPIGSGNGLARNLRISKNIKSSISCIKNGDFLSIDVGKINEEYFFSNLGLGFDAQVIHNYQKINQYPFYSYLKAVFKTVTTNNNSSIFKIQHKKETFSVKPFLLFITNSNQMGYNLSLHKRASLTDGQLDLISIPSISLIEKLYLGFLLLIGKTDFFNKKNHLPFTQLTIKKNNHKEWKYQKDGEKCFLTGNECQIKIVSKSLHVICPT